MAIDMIEQDDAYQAQLARYPQPDPRTNRHYSLSRAINYILEARIEGALVECGVAVGNSVSVMAAALEMRKTFDREFYLYDTFTGTANYSDIDVNYAGMPAAEFLEGQPESKHLESTLDAAIQNIRSRTGYPLERMRFIRGPVEETIPATVPDKIALLRLDTDWYQGTRHELTYLYPLLSPGGVLIVDDYGHWRGCRRAVDEFIARLKPSEQILLHRVDKESLIGLKRG